MSKNQEKSLEFLTHALAEVGFSPAHARRACLATNLSGVPQAIEWALAHLDEESDPQAKDAHRQRGGYAEGANYSSGGSGADNGLVVELPDGKLFRLTNPNGRVVEMPNGSVVEMIDGQVVEMSNGQQLEMVDGSLIEIRPATIALDEGKIVGHRILDYELSRQVVNGGKRMPQQHSSDYAPAAPQASAAQRGGGAREEGPEKAQEMRRQQMQDHEAQLAEQTYELSQRDKQLANHQRGLRQQEDAVTRNRAQIQAEQDLLSKNTGALKKKEEELVAREARLERLQSDLSKQRDQIKEAEKDLKNRESAVRAAEAVVQANGASASSTVRQTRENSGEKTEIQEAMENIEVGVYYV